MELLDEGKVVQFDELYEYNDAEVLLKKKIIELYAYYSVKLLKSNKTVKHWNSSIVAAKYVIKKREGSFLYIPPYLPLAFCEYENFQGLMPFFDGYCISENYNIAHPFSRWLIESYSFLEEYYPNQLYILMNNKDINILNSTIKKLKSHLPEKYKPSDSLILTKKDFEIDIESLEIE